MSLAVALCSKISLPPENLLPRNKGNNDGQQLYIKYKQKRGVGQQK
tara:strand:+ start:235 stop:372 length:138 start_codon:yes stop_codon:yes gene_type:complete